MSNKSRKMKVDFDAYNIELATIIKKYQVTVEQILQDANEKKLRVYLNPKTHIATFQEEQIASHYELKKPTKEEIQAVAEEIATKDMKEESTE